MLNLWTTASNNNWNPSASSWNQVICPLKIYYESTDPNAFYEITAKFLCREPNGCNFDIRFRSMPQVLNDSFIDHTIETITINANNVLVFVIRFQATATTPRHITYYKSVININL